MEVIVEKGSRIEVLRGKQPVYHIWDNDDREIACHRPDVVELIRKLQEALRMEV